MKKLLRIRVLGLGEVGRRIALNAAHSGHHVFGVDTDPAAREQALEALDCKVSQITSFQSSLSVSDQIPNGKFDCTILALPTFHSLHGLVPDVILEVGANLAALVNIGELISVESTLPPGTTSGALRDILETGSGLEAGKDFYLVCSPERIDTIMAQDLKVIPKIVGGVTPLCTEVGSSVYRELVDMVVPVRNSTIAEFIKLLENSYRLINIAFINEFAALVRSSGEEIHEVIFGASTKPFGFMPFWPSIAAGGHCVPAAGRCFEQLSQSLGVTHGLISAVLNSNEQSAERVLQLVGNIDDLPIIVLGLAYKSESTQFTESPAIKLINSLSVRGISVIAADTTRPDSLSSEIAFVDANLLHGQFAAIVVAVWQPHFSAVLARITSPVLLYLTGSPPPHKPADNF
jgi:UDP-N-acetyl-D-glucosamine dehydrogenase